MQPAKVRAAWVAAALVAAAIFNAAPVTAATGLAMVATDPTCAGKPVNAACGGREQTGQVYRVPLDTDLVRVRSDGALVADWESDKYQWEAWPKVAAGRYYDTCDTDIPSGSPVAGGVCQAWSMRPRASAPATFSASVTSGAAPLSTVLTWNVPSGTNCAAGGVWSGTKAASGSETLSIVSSGSATLTCTVPGPVGAGAATLLWTAPTQNTDGTAYTNPKGYYVYRGPSDPPTNKSSLIDKSTLSFRVTNIPPNVPQWYAITAVNTSDVESDLAKSSQTNAGIPTFQTFNASPITFTVAQPVKRPRAPTLTITFDTAPTTP